MAKRGEGVNLAPRLIAVAVASCFATAPAWGNPTGAHVVNGTAGFARPNASTLRITNSPGAIINWQGFSIGAGEVTRFIQQSASSAVLNRVVGADISSIQGQLLSNGRVFLINPSGIVVGPGAVIDTAGFVGSTLAMQDADFLAGKLRFKGDDTSGRIVNQGWIKTSQGGQVMLVAPQIENSGLIHTPGGELILAAGKKLTLSSLDHEGVQFEVQAPTDSVVNVGKLLAEGGAIGVFAGTLKHSGEIRATSLSLGATGQIVLKAQKDVELAAGSITTVSGVTGGSVQIQSGDTTLVSGVISARGTSSGEAGAGAGGTIHVLGDKVGLLDHARVDASGETGGGTVLIGGDFQGKNPAIQDAFRTYVGPDSVIKADAITNGDGGRVIVWSDDATRAYGTISARGGALSGNGGFVETSGHYLEVTRAPDLGAPNGRGGTWLLDPVNIEIVAGNTLVNNTGVPNFTPSVTNSQVGADLIAGQLNNNINVILDTSVAGADLGNIVVNSAIVATPTGSPILTLNANNLISIAQPISMTTASVPAGQVRLVSGNGITQAAGAPITANMLLADGGAGSVDLQATNMVGTLAGRINVPTTTSTSRSFLFNNGQSLTVGTVGGVSGVNVNIGPMLSQSYTINIDLATTTGDLVINQPVTATLSIILCVAGSTCPNLTTPLSLSAARDINVNQGLSGSVLTLGAGRDITVNNLNAAAAEIRAFGEAGTGVGSSSSVTMDAGRNLTVTNSNIEASSLPVALGTGTATIDFSTGTGLININGGSSVIAGINFPVAGAGSQSITLTGASGVTIADSTVRSGASFGAKGPSTIDITASAGPVQVTNGTISAFAGDGGNAMVSLTGNGITVNSGNITATGGSESDATGGAATIQLLSQSSLDILNGSTLTATGGFGFDGGAATVTLEATNGAITVNNSNASAIGGSASGGVGGAATVTLLATTAPISINNTSNISATGGSGSGGAGGAALVALTGAGITLNSSTIAATGGDGSAFTGGAATVSLTAPSGNINLGSNITVTGGNDSNDGAASIDITAEQGAILQAGVGAAQVTPGDNNSRTIDLFARSGIGVTGAPVQVAGGFTTLTADNANLFPGTSGNIVVSQTTGNVDLSLYNVVNAATNGGVDIKAELGSIIVPAPGFSNPNGPVTFRADIMDIQGPVTSALGTGSITLQTSTAARPIEMGTIGDAVAALALSGIELSNLSGGSLTIGSLANPVSVTDAISFSQSLSLLGAVTVTGSGSLDIGGATNTLGSIAGTGSIVLSGGALAVGGDNASTIFSGVISGTGGLTKQGTGTLTLSGANTYIGATTVNTGSLALNGGAAIADAGAVNLAASGALMLGASETIGSFTGAAGATVVLGGNTLTVGGAGDTTFAGVMSGTGGLTKQGGGTLTLSGANTYTGTTTVNAGTLALNGGTAIADTGAVNLAASGTALILGASETIGSLSGVAGTTVVLAAHTLTAGDADDTSFAGVMSGTGGLTKQGTGRLTLSGANTYTGATRVNAGTLGLGASDVIADGSGVVVNGGTLDVGAFNDTVGGVRLISGAVAGTTGVLTSLSTYDMRAGTVSANLGGAVGMNKTTAGTLTLSGANTYMGATTVNAGTLVLDGATLSGTLVNQSTTTVNGSALVSGGVEHSGTLNLNSGGSLTVGGTGFDWQGGTLAGAGSLALSGGAPFKVTSGATHTLNGPTIAIANLDLTGGSLNLQSGTVNVSDTITVGSGATLASQGATISAPGATLNLSGVFEAGPGSVTMGTMNVLGGGLFKGTGTVHANVNNSAGTVSPGLSPGILTIDGNYVQGANGTLNMDIGGTVPGPSGHDQLVVTGTATLGGTLSAGLINGFIPATGDSFTLIKAGTVTGAFATTNLPAGTFLAPTYLVSSFVVSVPPPTVSIPPTVPPVVEVEVERLRKTVEEGPQEPEKAAPTAPLCL